MLDRKICSDCRDRTWGGADPGRKLDKTWSSWYCPAKETYRRLPVAIAINDTPPLNCYRLFEQSIAFVKDKNEA